MRKLIFGAAALLAVALNAGTAEAYSGGWMASDNRGGDEILFLGDNSDDTYREFRGTQRYCGRPGASYAQVRNVLRRNVGEQITWWEDATCNDGYVRVCVENWRGETACSTYEDYGW